MSHADPSNDQNLRMPAEESHCLDVHGNSVRSHCVGFGLLTHDIPIPSDSEGKRSFGSAGVVGAGAVATDDKETNFVRTKDGDTATVTVEGTSSERGDRTTGGNPKEPWDAETTALVNKTNEQEAHQLLMRVDGSSNRSFGRGESFGRDQSNENDGSLSLTNGSTREAIITTTDGRLHLTNAT